VFPDPLHPAVVHLPLALAALLPLAAAAALWAIHRGARRLHAWAIPVVMAVLLLGSGWAGLRTGGAEEDRVEAVVAEGPIHEHEEAAERFMLAAGGVTLFAAVGLAGGTVGSAARLLTTAGTLVVLVTGVQVGTAGGELVYTHGAAEAYTSVSGAQRTGADPADPEGDDR
jgi:hypothetical protein